MIFAGAASPEASRSQQGRTFLASGAPGSGPAVLSHFRACEAAASQARPAGKGGDNQAGLCARRAPSLAAALAVT